MDKSIKILVAEDEFLISEEIIRQLEMKGYQNIIEASDGREAVQITMSEAPDIVIMDIKMPNMTGIEAAKMIKEFCPTPIIILTAYNDVSLLEEACREGVSTFLTKPPKGDEIERAIIISMARHSDYLDVLKLNDTLEKAMSELKTLKGIIPICSYCKDIRKDDGAWQKMEAYICNHSDAEFSHGICPSCVNKFVDDEGVVE